MTTTYPTESPKSTIVPGTAGRYYLVTGRKVVAGPFRSVADAQGALYCPEDGYEIDFDGASWYCDHDVPDGCPACRRDRDFNAMLDGMEDADRHAFLYGIGGSESFFAPYGPAFVAGL